MGVWLWSVTLPNNTAYKLSYSFKAWVFGGRGGGAGVEAGCSAGGVVWQRGETYPLPDPNENGGRGLYLYIRGFIPIHFIFLQITT